MAPLGSSSPWGMSHHRPNPPQTCDGMTRGAKTHSTMATETRVSRSCPRRSGGSVVQRKSVCPLLSAFVEFSRGQAWLAGAFKVGRRSLSSSGRVLEYPRRASKHGERWSQGDLRNKNCPRRGYASKVSRFLCFALVDDANEGSWKIFHEQRRQEIEGDGGTSKGD
jgi:hypothetical protein